MKNNCSDVKAWRILMEYRVINRMLRTHLLKGNAMQTLWNTSSASFYLPPTSKNTSSELNGVCLYWLFLNDLVSTSWLPTLGSWHFPPSDILLIVFTWISPPDPKTQFGHILPWKLSRVCAPEWTSHDSVNLL